MPTAGVIYVNELCVGFSHKYCDGIVQVSITWDHKTEKTAPCECSCHTSGIIPATPLARRPKEVVRDSSTAYKKAEQFAMSQGLKGKALRDFMLAFEEQA